VYPARGFPSAVVFAAWVRLDGPSCRTRPTRLARWIPKPARDRDTGDQKATREGDARSDPTPTAHRVLDSADREYRRAIVTLATGPIRTVEARTPFSKNCAGTTLESATSQANAVG
jgi:hypothetical protein